MTDETKPPTLDYNAPPKRRSLLDRVLAFGNWLGTPRPLGTYYVVTTILGIAAMILAVLIRAIIITFSH